MPVAFGVQIHRDRWVAPRQLSPFFVFERSEHFIEACFGIGFDESLCKGTGDGNGVTPDAFMLDESGFHARNRSFEGTENAWAGGHVDRKYEGAATPRVDL